MREGEVLEVPDFDDLYASDVVSMLFPVEAREKRVYKVAR